MVTVWPECFSLRQARKHPDKHTETEDREIAQRDHCIDDHTPPAGHPSHQERWLCFVFEMLGSRGHVTLRAFFKARSNQDGTPQYMSLLIVSQPSSHEQLFRLGEISGPNPLAPFVLVRNSDPKCDGRFYQRLCADCCTVLKHFEARLKGMTEFRPTSAQSLQNCIAPSNKLSYLSNTVVCVINDNLSYKKMLCDPS